MSLPRHLIASLAAPLAALAPALLLVACAFLRPEVIDSGDSDAPQRVIGAFLVALPVLYVALAAFSYATGTVLLRLGARTLRAFLLAAAVLAAGLCLLIFVPASGHVLKGQRVPIATFLSLSTLAGAACWFLVAKRDS